MKKLFHMIVAIAMVVSYLPVAEAADSADLTITATFVDLDIVRVNEISAELDGIATGAEGIYMNAVNSGDIDVIRAAIDELKGMIDHIEQALLPELADILAKRPDLETLINGVIAKAGDIERTIGGYIEELIALLPQLAIWSEPAGPFNINEGETLEFKVIAEDLDTVNVTLEAISLPDGARWIVDSEQPISATRREGTFIWTPSFGKAGNDPDGTVYSAVFEAKNQEGETAELEARITVLPGQNLVIWSDPEGPFEVMATRTLEFNVLADDPDADVVEFYAHKIPEGATFTISEVIPGEPATGIFTWTPTEEQVAGAPYTATFYARSYDGNYWQEAEQTELTVEITVLPAPVIAIELNSADWRLDGVAYGDIVDNRSPLAIYPPIAMHEVTSRSNINIGVDIGYASWQGYNPGADGPGDGIFAMMLCEDGYGQGVYLPVPDPGASAMIPLVENLQPDASKQVPLRLYAPTKGDPDVSLSVVLEMRAYSAE